MAAPPLNPVNGGQYTDFRQVRMGRARWLIARGLGTTG
jgi:hypothetical protein